MVSLLSRASIRTKSVLAALLGEMLKYNGYATAWFGKDHNVPDWHSKMAGPFDLWPTGLGFDYFFGFLGGDANQTL